MGFIVSLNTSRFSKKNVTLERLFFISLTKFANHNHYQNSFNGDHRVGNMETTSSSSSNEPLLKKKKKQGLSWIEWLRGWFNLFYEFLFQRITASHLHNPMPLPPINDLTCIVTGSTSGIGLQIARYYYPFVFSHQFLVFDWILIVGFCFD